MSELAVHPVAALFPMLADDELDELAAEYQSERISLPARSRVTKSTNAAALFGRSQARRDGPPRVGKDADLIK
jgi:hypothetical protein